MICSLTFYQPFIALGYSSPRLFPLHVYGHTHCIPLPLFMISYNTTMTTHLMNRYQNC
ncbi:hypothetical protein BDR03DRAFT_957440 [Suillus americanus]|nr:hypothetical protein BDR03DRAFT_957440 [Suillus americanus]